MAQSVLPVGSSMPELRTEAALRAVQPEMAALEDGDLLPINLDVVWAVSTVLGRLPILRPMLPEITEHLPKFDVDSFDKLEQYALALNQANAIHRGTLAQRSSIAELGAEVTETRDRLFDDAKSLANYGLMNGERLKECKKAPGYRAAVTDVFTLVTLFKEYWSKIEGRTPTTEESLQKAGSRALELLGAVGEKELTQTTPAEAQLMRQRAYTLFFKAYEDTREVVRFLRRKESEAVKDSIVPSLFGNRTRGSAAAEPVTSNDTAAPAPTVKAVAKDEGPAADPVTQVKINNPHNLPVDSPFI